MASLSWGLAEAQEEHCRDGKGQVEMSPSVGDFSEDVQLGWSLTERPVQVEWIASCIFHPLCISLLLPCAMFLYSKSTLCQYGIHPSYHPAPSTDLTPNGGNGVDNPKPVTSEMDEGPVEGCLLPCNPAALPANLQKSLQCLDVEHTADLRTQEVSMSLARTSRLDTAFLNTFTLTFFWGIHGETDNW